MVKNILFPLSLNAQNVNNTLESGFLNGLTENIKTLDTIKISENSFCKMVIHKNSCNNYTKVICLKDSLFLTDKLFIGNIYVIIR